MLTPEQLTQIPASLVTQIQDLEDYIIKEMARRIAKASELTQTAAGQLEIAKMLGFGYEIEKQVAEILSITIEEAVDIMYGAAETSVAVENAIYAAAGKGTSDILSPAMQSIIDQAIRQTSGELTNMSRSLGFMVKQNGQRVFLPIASAYQSELNKAVLRLRTGVADPRTVVKDAVNSLAGDSGLVWVDYASGHHNRLDVAVRRAVHTGTSQMTLRMTDRMMEDLGAEYVEVSAHPGARPEHALWQGGVYHVGGSLNGYPDFVETTGYGTGPGLGGWNCSHVYFPFFPGISERTWSDKALSEIDPPPFEYEGTTYTRYDALQQQRVMETQLRDYKRQLAGLDGAGTIVAKDFQNLSIRYQTLRQEYKTFSNAGDLTYQLERAGVRGFGQSYAQRVIWANRRARLN